MIRYAYEARKVRHSDAGWIAEILEKVISEAEWKTAETFCIVLVSFMELIEHQSGRTLKHSGQIPSSLDVSAINAKNNESR